MSAKSTKGLLRETMRRILSELPRSRQWQESQELSVRIFENEHLLRARSVACYLPKSNGEVDTSPIIQRLFQMEKKVYVPLVHLSSLIDGCKGGVVPSDWQIPDKDDITSNPGDLLETITVRNSEMTMIRVRDFRELGSFERNQWGIPEPRQREHKMWLKQKRNCFDPTHDNIDVIIVPGLAFDSENKRLGHGAGYYDRFLDKYVNQTGHKKPTLLGMCFSCQRLDADSADGGIPQEIHDFVMDQVIVGADYPIH